MGGLQHTLKQEFIFHHGNCSSSAGETGSGLHIIEPTGFILNDKYLRRAGMDYWDHLRLTRYINYEDFLARNPGATVWYATTKAHQCYTDVHYGLHDFIMFGKESAGIPEDILVENEDHCIRIPMGPDMRCGSRGFTGLKNTEICIT